MKVRNCSDYEDMSQAGAGFIRSVLNEKPEALICFATGSSPRRMYELLADDPVITRSSLRALALDEWYGLDSGHPSTCQSFLKNKVFEPWLIPEERRFVWNAQASDPGAECQRMSAILEREGPMDLCILGLGQNGHLGFNEPAEALQPDAHVAALEVSSQKHSMVAAVGTPLTHGLTFGMADILGARRILMLVTGKGKETVARQFLMPEITSRLPASFLHLHSSVTVLTTL